MSIRIGTKRVVTTDKGLCRKIIYVSMLSADALPGRYMAQNGAIYKAPGGCWPKETFIVKDSSHADFLKIGTIYTEHEFQSKLTLVRIAGDMLRKLNEEKRELEAKWYGEETFLI